MGRKSGYTSELGELICELTAEGASLRDIAEQPGMPPRQTITRWAATPDLSDPDFPGRYARARDLGCHAQFEQLRDLEDRLLDYNDKIDPHAARVAIDTIKWRLSKMLPGVYGDRTHIEHSGEVKTSPKDHAPQWMEDLLRANKTGEQAPPNETRH